MKTTEQFWTDALEPLFQFHRENRNAVMIVAGVMRDLSGQDYTRQHVITYIHREAAERHEPRLGVGLLLIASIKELRRRKVIPKEAK